MKVDEKQSRCSKCTGGGEMGGCPDLSGHKLKTAGLCDFLRNTLWLVGNRDDDREWSSKAVQLLPVGVGGTEAELGRCFLCSGIDNRVWGLKKQSLCQAGADKYQESTGPMNC